MSRDSLVDEVRSIRDQYAKSRGYDLARICADLRARDAEAPAKTVSLPARRIVSGGCETFDEPRRASTP